MESVLDFQVILKSTKDIIASIPNPLDTTTISKLMLILGNLLQLEEKLLNQVDANKEVMEVLDAVIFHFIHSSSHTTASANGKYIAFALKKFRSRSVTFSTRSLRHKANITLLYENQVGATSWLKLSKENFEEGEESVLFYEMMTNHAMPTLTNQTRVTNILSAKILTNKKTFQKLEHPVEIKFDVGQLSGVNVSCRFWDVENGK